MGNKHSPTVICAAITSKLSKTKLPTHIELESQANQISKDSIVLLEQVRTIDKTRLREKICQLDNKSMQKINHALFISFGLEFKK
jgi:mRNA interferase MazF